MNRPHFTFRKTLLQICLLVSLVGASVVAASAQQVEKIEKPPISIEVDRNDDHDRPHSDIEEEMKAKRAIRYAEKEYQENVERARDLSSLGAAIVNSYKLRNGLNGVDLKKLEKVEKLAKSIRNAAGGSGDDGPMEKPPKDLGEAMEMLACLSSSLKEKVEKTPRQVISAAVIDEANVLLEVIKIVRTLPAKV